MSTSASVADSKQKHPDGLFVLFFTEMWERFSYYGMRALLVLYMIKGLKFAQADSSRIYGWYTGLVYMTPILGGLLADRKLGYRKTILIGGVLMMIGHFLMAIETLPFFYAALGFLILGNGAFKPNISTLVGKLYKEGDPRRDAGFTIFYMGINLGAAASPLVCGTLGEKYGWGWGFGAAGVGMLIGLLIFIFGQSRLKAINVDLPEKTPSTNERASTTSEALTPLERGRVWALLICAVFTIFFWLAFEQAGNTMTLWADENTVRTLFGFEIPASWFQSINPMLIFAFAPVLSIVWGLLSARGREVSSVMKFVLGLTLLGCGFVVMVGAATAAGSETGKVSPMWLVGAYFLQTIGELCLSPIGLSMVTKLAPARLGGMLMGVWFLAVFVGNKAAGMMGELYSQMPHVKFYGLFVVTSLVAAAILFALKAPLKRLMAGAA